MTHILIQAETSAENTSMSSLEMTRSLSHRQYQIFFQIIKIDKNWNEWVEKLLFKVQ